MARRINSFRWACLALLILVLLGSSCAVMTPQPLPKPVSSTTTPEPENRKPVINYITSEQQVLPSSSSRITCVATDADGDPLIYAWSAEKGTIAGTGDTVTWNAPETPGTYNVSVSVTDGKGTEAKGSVKITVTAKPNRAPTGTLIVTKKNEPPVTVEAATEKIRMKQWSTVEIQCKAEDPDGDPLTYRWAATGGKIEGEGPNVRYISTATGDFAVTVTVIDSKGAQFKTSAYFHVPCCGGF